LGLVFEPHTASNQTTKKMEGHEEDGTTVMDYHFYMAYWGGWLRCAECYV